ncbi:unnamed protein product, partial [Brassica rapa subsp. trilocularis]
NLPPTGLTASPLAPWILWGLWTARNKAIFENATYTASEILVKALLDAKEWESANQTSQKSRSILTLPKSRPMENSPNCWVDGAWIESSLCGGFGWIIKSTSNSILCKDSASRTYVGSALIAEALAIRQALRAAAFLGLLTLNVFSDSLVLISALSSGSDLNEIAGILSDIRDFASLFDHLSFSHVSRTCNIVADSLAKSAL